MQTPSPRLSRTHRCAASALLLLACIAAMADVVNVSALVTGTAERTPSTSSRTPCGSSCAWATASGTAVGDSFQVDPGTLKIATWPPLWVANPPAAKPVQDDEPVAPPPTGPMWTGLPDGPRHLSQVAYNDYVMAPNSLRQLSVENFRIGLGASVLSYAVRITNTSGLPQAQWLEFTVPTDGSAFVTATNPFGGPSGYESVTAAPQLQANRSAVEVLVDGLPVWSSARSQLIPKRYPGAQGALILHTGAALGSGKTTLFLGTLPAKAVTHVAVVLRSDARLNAPDCKIDSGGSLSSTTYRRCHAHREQLNIPSISQWPGAPVLRPAIDVVLN